MTASQPPSDRPDADLEAADFLLSKADALLRRHRSTEAGAAEDDLPILTEVVDDGGTAAAPEATAAPESPSSPDLTELLIRLDTEISLEVEAWLANELPQLLSRELDSLVERVRVQALAHLRATLLPALSDRLAAYLDEAAPPD